MLLSYIFTLIFDGARDYENFKWRKKHDKKYKK